MHNSESEICNKWDGANKWDNRKQQVLSFIEEENADIICLQEVLNRQLVDINAFQNSYSYVGAGREDGKTKGEYAPISYKKTKYIKVEDGIFWLSEHPDSIGSIGWDAGQPRIATWAILIIAEPEYRCSALMIPSAAESEYRS